MKTSVSGSTLLAILLLASAAAATTHSLKATLDGAQEVPAVTTNATGSATLTYDDQTKMLTGTLTFQNVTPTMVHIHKGDPGANGAARFTLGTASPVAIDASLTTDDENALFDGGTYFNVHSATNGAGEIRGQIVFDNGAASDDAGSPSTGSSGSAGSSGSSGSSGTDTGSSGSNGAVTTRPDAGDTSTPATSSSSSSCSAAPGSSSALGAGVLAIAGLALLARGRRKR